MRSLLETEKNFLKCGILMVIVGIGLMFMGENSIGIGSIVLGVVFLGCMLVSYIKNKDEDSGKNK